jgi:hypothetical protein
MQLGNRFIACTAGILFSLAAVAQTPPAAAPAGATGLCRDGTYWTSATKRGACHGHKGVQEWYAGAAPAAASPAPAAAPAAPAATPAAAPAAAPATPAAAKASAPRTAQAPGAAPGMVWVNSASKVYHCSADRWYGRTKQGSYMTESEAVSQGNRPDHGKACH